MRRENLNKVKRFQKKKIPTSNKRILISVVGWEIGEIYRF
jgi:hypothetical protein